MSLKSRSCEFLPTAPRSNRTFLLKSKKELEALPDDSTDIEADNIIKRYARRHQALENYCLADFVSKIVSVSKIASKESPQMEHEQNSVYHLNDDENEDEGIDNHSNSMDTSQTVQFSVIDGDFRIVLRTKRKIIRYVKYIQKIDPENYFREQLMLFYPWRKEGN